MSLAHYLLQVNIYLVIFYCFYRLLLASETYFLLNRIYLLASATLSLAIPFLRFEWFSKQQMAKPIYIGVDQLKGLVSQVSVIDDKAMEFNWGNLILVAYLAGVIFCIVRLIVKLISVSKIFKTVGKGMAFSFLRKKRVDLNVPEMATVNIHEDIHIKQLHTLDVLFFELIGIFAWFNPVVYAYQKNIKNIHEYLADEASAKFQGDKEAYALLLLSQAFGVQPNTLTNGFFTKSLIKKRILMLHKQRSKKIAILKYGLFVPLFALTLVCSSATIRKNNRILAMAEKIQFENVNKVVQQAIDAPLSVINLAPIPPKTDTIKSTPAEDVTFENAPEETPSTETESLADFGNFYKYLGERLQYPASAIAKKLQGNTVINFSVRHGKINNAVVLDELGEGCDEEVINEILAYNDFIRKDGNYSLKVTFKLQGADSEIKNQNTSAADGYTELPNVSILGFLPVEEENNRVHTFTALAKPPTYPGGMEKFYKFLAENIKYPTPAIDNEIQGNVYLSFTVEKDGSLTDIKVERKLGFGTDEEAIRVMKLTRRWNPGMQNGKPVRVKYNVPIKFSFYVPKSAQKTNAITSITSKSFTDKDAPMVILDNEPKSYDYLKNMNQKDIESIDILTGTTATNRYGKGGEKGVIIIKSKSAKAKEVTATFTNKN